MRCWKPQLGNSKTIRAPLPWECHLVRSRRTLRKRAAPQVVLEAGLESSVHSVVSLPGIPFVHPSSASLDTI